MPAKGLITSPREGHPPAALTHLAVAGYRSLQQLTLPLGGLTLVCGANGCGKSNLYRSLGLISAAARGDLVATLAAEGGLPAVFWASRCSSGPPGAGRPPEVVLRPPGARTSGPGRPF